MSKKQNTNDEVMIIWKLSNEEKSLTSQKTDDSTNYLDNILVRPDFGALNKLYDESFIVSGLLDKIQSSVWNSINTDNEELQKILNKIDHSFLNESLEFYWNAFFEVIREKYWKKRVIRLIPVPAHTIYKLKKWWFVQQVGTQKVYFNDFVWDLKDRNKQIKIWEKSWAKSNELVTDKAPWFNPELNEIFHFKRTSLTDIHYWKTLYIPVLDQLLLLEQIDQFFTWMFNRGWMWNAIIFVKQNGQIKTKLSDTWKKALQDFFQNNFSWVKNAGNHAIVQTELWKLDLTDDFDVTAFIEKTFELLKKVAIALNVPYEVLLTIVWNKSTAEQAEKNFINHKIKPLQKINIKFFNELFSYDYSFNTLEYDEIETWNPLDKMKILTGYVWGSIMTINEARKKLWLEEIEWGNDLVLNKQDTTQEDLIEEKIKEQVIEKIEQESLNLIKDVKNDFYKNI